MAVVTQAYIYSFDPAVVAGNTNLVEVRFTQSIPEPTYARDVTYLRFFEYINTVSDFITTSVNCNLRDFFSNDPRLTFKSNLGQVAFQTVLDAVNTHFAP